MIRRTWFAHRQAYTPRTWPYMLVVSPTCGALGWIGATYLGWWGMLITVPLGLAAGWFTTHLVWQRWRREHPALTARQLIDVQRKAGPFN